MPTLEINTVTNVQWVFTSMNDLPFCCGVSDIGSFQSIKKVKRDDFFGDDIGKGEWDNFDSCGDIAALPCKGTGIFTATFVDTAVCRKAYEQLIGQHKLLYQSEPRTNSNSGRKVFLCVFLHKDKA